jgi:asparagine synthase (glutamine-hydrolysing)
MCAIFGIIGEINPATLRGMSSCQIYRGPDKQSFFIDKKNKFSIGMNRLSVIDKKYGTQPMFSYDKRYIIVFNGTIYNFNELKKFLSKKKINFNTNSDTEVLINAYSYWGNKCFNYFDGMWAVGIYDFKIKKFILSRDYVGQKPLFYYNHNEKLIFSSQINGIFKYSKKFNFKKKL